jgi:hypothetical protein
LPGGNPLHVRCPYKFNFHALNVFIYSYLSILYSWALLNPDTGSGWVGVGIDKAGSVPELELTLQYLCPAIVFQVKEIHLNIRVAAVVLYPLQEVYQFTGLHAK